MPRPRRRLFFLAYTIYGLLVGAMSFLVVFVRVLSKQPLTQAEVIFMLPGALLIGPFFPGPHSGPEFFPGVVITNTLAYVAIPLMVGRVAWRVRSGGIKWSDLGCFALLLALWAALARLRGPTCPWEWWLAVEGLVVAAATWFASDRIVARLLKGRRDLNSRGVEQQIGWASLGVGVALVLIYGLAGVTLCWGRA